MQEQVTKKPKTLKKKIKRLIKNRDFWIKFVMVVSALALIASTFLPFLLL